MKDGEEGYPCSIPHRGGKELPLLVLYCVGAGWWAVWWSASERLELLGSGEIPVGLSDTDAVAPEVPPVLPKVCRVFPLPIAYRGKP